MVDTDANHQSGSEKLTKLKNVTCDTCKSIAHTGNHNRLDFSSTPGYLLPCVNNNSANLNSTFLKRAVLCSCASHHFKSLFLKQVQQLLPRTMSSKKLFNVVFVLGGPGAGKGTQCEKIQETFGYQHLSAGELLRQERLAPGSQYGEEIDKHIKDGSIVPVSITCSLLLREMRNSSKNNFLVDGFPRNQDNLEGWNKETEGVARVQRVLFFDCPDDICVERCLSRGLTSGRTDDNAESLKKRIQTYRDSTMPIVDHFRKLNLVSEIQGDRSPNEVFEDVKKVFASLK
ncbi:cytidine monophosphate (UMP-CMP) kinase 1 cytosolic [Biomphalaria glabrata]|nr:UMP-CMP kinase [Biomphalaria glabrata]